MAFVASGEGRVTLALVALGFGPTTVELLRQLADHRANTSFDVVCVVNAHDGSEIDAPAGVKVVTHRANLGWVGGLHIARAHAQGDYLAWLQEDIVVLEGWLDSAVAALDSQPRAGIVGSVIVDDAGNLNGLQCGQVPPGTPVQLWSSYGIEPDRDSAPFQCDWISSGGSVVRLEAWDQIGGVDVRLYPLGFVDFGFCAHLRLHGWEVWNQPAAAIKHGRHGSRPGPVIEFSSIRNLRLIQEEFAGLLPLEGSAAGTTTPHRCVPWLGEAPERIGELTLIEASLLVLPFSRFAAATAAERLADAHWLADEARGNLLAVERSHSWRITAPLRATSRLLRWRSRGKGNL